MHASHVRGLFEFNGSCVITAVRAVIQDQDAETQEVFSWVVRRGSDSVGPTPGSAGLLGMVRGLKTPQGHQNPAAYVMVTILHNKIRMKDCTSHFSFGLRLERAPKWPSDGLSTHMSSFLSQHSHLRQEDHAWDIVGAATVATHPSGLRSWRYEVFTFFGTMRLGCGGRFGMGGMFPRTSTRTVPLSLAAFFRGGTACAGGTPLVAIGVIRTLGVSLGQTGRFYLAGPLLVLSGPPTNRNGSGLVQITPFLPATAAGRGMVHLQGAIRLPNGAMKLTNAQSITL